MYRGKERQSKQKSRAKRSTQEVGADICYGDPDCLEFYASLDKSPPANVPTDSAITQNEAGTPPEDGGPGKVISVTGNGTVTATGDSSLKGDSYENTGKEVGKIKPTFYTDYVIAGISIVGIILGIYMFSKSQ